MTNSMEKSSGKSKGILSVVIMAVLTALLCFVFLYLSFIQKSLGTITIFHVSGELFSIVICQMMNFSFSKAGDRERIRTIIETSRGFLICRVLCIVLVLLMAVDSVAWMCFGYLAEGTSFWMTLWYLIPMAAIALAYAGTYRWMSQRSKKLEESFRHLMSENVVTEIRKEEGAPAGRTAYVTVLFCMVKGLEKRDGHKGQGDTDDSALHRFLRLFYSQTAEICEKYGGTALEFPGYSVLCVFGAPEERKDHESAAMKTALEIMEEMKALQKLRNVTGFPVFDIGIGINTGNIHVGNVGSDSQKRFTVIGSGVNLASRLAGYADAGEIIISENVRKAVPEAAFTEKVDKVMPKGFDEPIGIYRVKQKRGFR